MTKDSSNGVWSLKQSGDLNGIYYTYLVTVNGKTNETRDVYSTACGVNSKRSMVVDLNSTNPDGWNNDSHVLFNISGKSTGFFLNGAVRLIAIGTPSKFPKRNSLRNIKEEIGGEK